MAREAKAMLISVGTSPEPIIHSIKNQLPEFVCFFTSEQSVEQISIIKSALDFSFTDRKVIVENYEDVVECYHKALDCINRVKEAGYTKDEVLVDFTGGSKPMSGVLLALSLAEGYDFIYVGGTQRDQANRGIVVTGSEKLVLSSNPWNLYAVEQKKKLCLYFNRYQFTACQEIIKEALANCRKGSVEEALFDGLEQVVDGYLEWDRFEHKLARDALKKGLDLLEVFIRFRPGASIVDFVAGLKENLAYLNRFSQDTLGFQKLSRWHILDLMGNAKRRYNEGKYDDAVARLYRVLEMTAQERLFAAYKINTSEVKPEQVPEKIRDSYILKYSKGEHLQIPLAASYNLLQVMGDRIGEVFVDCRTEIDKVLFARNHSILAHGIKPVGKDLYPKFEKTVLHIGDINEAEIPVFPKLDV